MDIQPAPLRGSIALTNNREGTNVLEKLTVATFADRVHETFRIDADGTPVDVELIEVTDLTSRGGPEAGKRERAPFSIVFRGPREPVPPQRIYRLEHAEIGAFELFLVPIGPDAQGMRYEAIFT